MKDPLLPNTVRQKDEKPPAGLNDTAVPHVKIKITEIPFEKKLNTPIPSMSPSGRVFNSDLFKKKIVSRYPFQGAKPNNY